MNMNELKSQTSTNDRLSLDYFQPVTPRKNSDVKKIWVITSDHSYPTQLSRSQVGPACG